MLVSLAVAFSLSAYPAFFYGGAKAEETPAVEEVQETSTEEQEKSSQSEIIARNKEKSRIDRKKKNRISYLECEIAKVEKKMAAIEAVLSNPGEGDDIMELTRSYLECKRDHDAWTEEWCELSE